MNCRLRLESNIFDLNSSGWEPVGDSLIYRNPVSIRTTTSEMSCISTVVKRSQEHGNHVFSKVLTPEEGHNNLGMDVR